MGFPGGPVVKNLPANAGDMGSIPALGRFHMPPGQLVHTPQLLSLHTLEPMLHNMRSLLNEKAPTSHSKEE